MKAMSYTHYPKAIFLLCFLTSHFLYAQTSPNYDSFLEAGEVKIKSTYQYLISKTEKGAYLERTFYPERKFLTAFATYKTADLKVLQGQAAWWYDNGHRRAAGRYQNGKAVGYWRYYSQKTGVLTAEGTFKDSERQGKWLDYDEQGKLERESYWKNGIKHGTFIRYDKEGNIVNQGRYRKGELLQQTNEEYDGVYPKQEVEDDAKAGTTYTRLGDMPYFKALEEIEDKEERLKTSQKALLRWLNENITYPDFAREMEIEGKVVIAFTIDVDGSLVDIEVIHGISESLEKESLRVIESLPAWNPGQIKGKPVRVRQYLPIRFKLN